MRTHIGEVVESNTASFIAEVSRGSDMPAFGSWIELRTQQGMTLFGVVSLVEYGSTMPGRRATALGKTHEELLHEMPQVMELLRASFHARVVGYARDEQPVFQALPPFPAGIHDFIYPCAQERLTQFGAPYDFIQLLMNSGDRSTPNDELLIAALNNLFVKPIAHSTQPLVDAGRVLSRLLKDDHQRLQSVLRRLQQRN